MAEQGDADPLNVDLQTDRPHPARVYDYALGGKDNFAADREAVTKALQANPDMLVTPRANRAYLRRAVRFLAGEVGIRQFLDIGTGIPTAPNVHQIAQEIDPAARVVYADNDPIVLAHARALLTGSPDGKVAYLDADIRDVESILGSPDLRDTLDLDRPVGLLLLAIMHSISDEDEPYGIVSRLLDAVPSGSYLAFSQITTDFAPEKMRAVAAASAQQSMPMHFRSRVEIERFFEGLEMVEPGFVPVQRWRPETTPELSDAQVNLYGGVARKP